MPAGLLGPAFAGDTGEADRSLDRALDDLRAGTSTRTDVLRVLASARVFVALAAQRGVGATAGSGDQNAEMTLVTVVGRDGRRALPVFTSGAAFRRWREDLRPVPVEGARAARTAVDDGAAALLIDPGTAHSLVVTGPELDRLAAVWSRAVPAPPARRPADEDAT